jgi:hypothetical protein
MLVGFLAARFVPSALAQSAPPSPQVPNAEAIYDGARAAAARLPVPPYLAYTADFTFDRKGRTQTRHERILLRTSDGHAFVRRLPDSPADHVDTAPRVVTQGAKDDPAAAMPLTTFGLRPKTGSGDFLESAATPVPSPSADANTIASVHAVDRAYAVAFDGGDTVEGRPAWRLALVPRRDPQHNRIRELTVDAQTLVPLRYVIEVQAEAGPVRKSFLVTCDTADIQGYRLIVRAAASLSFRALFVTFAGSGTYALRDISFPAALPDWLFDPAAIKDHAAGPFPG